MPLRRLMAGLMGATPSQGLNIPFANRSNLAMFLPVKSLNRFCAAFLVTAIVALAEDAPKPVPAPASSEAVAKKPVLPDDAAAAWKALNKAAQPPLPPAEWNSKTPSPEEKAAFRGTMATAAIAAADLAKEFQTRFAGNEHLAEAKDLQRDLLKAAVSLGNTDRLEELKALGGEPGGQSAGAAAPAPTDAFGLRFQAAIEAAKKEQEKGMSAVYTEFERQLRLIQKDFPERPEVVNGLLEVAQGLGGEHGLAILKELEDSKPNDQLKQVVAQVRKQIASEQKKKDRVGKPLDIKFTAVDGRPVDLAALKGKVVLVDFWATWCGPCVAELPHVKDAYAKLHDQGFEIVGISLDQEKDSLDAFVKKQAMPWPQYFDGEGWQNKYAQEFGIMGIPAMWLVDKQGNLRDLEAREGLDGKIEKLLSEK